MSKGTWHLHGRVCRSGGVGESGENVSRVTKGMYRCAGGKTGALGSAVGAKDDAAAETESRNSVAVVP
jgi:hypothetical protein